MRDKNPNYKGMYILGLALLALGSSFIAIFDGKPTGPVFIAIGGLFLIISIKHKKEWQNKSK